MSPTRAALWLASLMFAGLHSARVRAADELGVPLPADTGIVIVVETQKFAETPLGKRLTSDKPKPKPKPDDPKPPFGGDTSDSPDGPSWFVLQSVGFPNGLGYLLTEAKRSPTKDATRMIVAFPKLSEREKALWFLKGRFDKGILAPAAKPLEQSGYKVESHKHRDATLVEVVAPNGDRDFVGLAKDGTLVAGSERSRVTDALDAITDGKIPAPPKALAAILAKCDPKDMLRVAATGAAADKLNSLFFLARDPVDLKKVEEVYGGVSVNEGLKGSLTITCSDAATAATITRELDRTRTAAALLAGTFDSDEKLKKMLTTVADFLKVIRFDQQGRTARITADVSKSAIEKFLDGLGF